jgi:NADH:ubiquinone oxidoreductase subunit B-like Fe-S oxidoreductase
VEHLLRLRLLAHRCRCKPVGWDDPFYTGVNDELADKGFLVTSTDNLIQWARTGSLMWMTFGWPAARLK